jgi:parallel beta-helix repeat protein
MRKFLLGVTVIGAVVLAIGVVAASAATGYSFFGNAQLVSPGEASAHAVQATSTGTPAYGGVNFAVPSGLTVAGLSTLSTDSMFTLGSCGLGSPRFEVGVTNGTPTGTGNLFFYLGPPPNYTGCALNVWAPSGNLAAASNLVDATQIGGSFYESYGDVQTAYGSYTVSSIALVVDGPGQTVQFDNAQINSTTNTFDPTCTQTGFFRDGINMTAAQIGGNVTGSLDAAGCNIGVYYDNTHTGNVSGANISGATYFGVVVNGDAGAVSGNVTGSTIHDIGETPLTGQGSQHGTAIYYRAFAGGTASGTISGNTIRNYQKGGITISGNVSASITKNTVTGQGPVAWIAQNGIQVGYGAKATVTGNTVTNNAYTGANLASSAGILVVGGACFGTGLAYTVGLDISKNTLTTNDIGVWLFNADSNCVAPTTKTNNSVKVNTISNAAVTNTTGYNATCGYQAGIADVGHRDLIVNNAISGTGYTPVSGDCTATAHAFLRFIDLDSSARAVPSNK